MKDAIVIIPSRLDSKRLPNKPLKDINGKSMIRRIYEQVTSRANFDTYIASGDIEIHNHIKGFGGKSVLVDGDGIVSGSDRVKVAYELIPNKDDYRYVVNFQGDAVNTRPEIITDLVELMKSNDNIDIATPVMIMDAMNYDNPSCVKAVASLGDVDSSGRALYFSRSKLPFDRFGEQRSIYHHIGIYVYKPSVLNDFTNTNQTILEQREGLEQLRALEIGKSIFVKLINKLKIYPDAPADVDELSELEAIRREFTNQHS